MLFLPDDSDMNLSFTIKLLYILSQKCTDSTLYCKQCEIVKLHHILQQTNKAQVSIHMIVVKLGHMHNIMFAIQ